MIRIVRAAPAIASAALLDVVAARIAGEPVLLDVLIDDARAAAATMLGGVLLANAADRDRRVALFDALAAGEIKADGRPQSAFGTLAGDARQALADAVLFADGCLVGSWTEYRRIASSLGVVPSPPVFAPLPQGTASPATGARRYVVVWAPELEPAQTAVYYAALEDLHAEVVFVTRTAGGAPPGARYVDAASGAAYLDAACVVVVTDTIRPSTAVALAALQRPLAVSSTSGADEALEGVPVFHPWAHRSIAAAVVTAMGEGAPRVRRAAETSQTRRVPALDGPLATIVIPTYNRRDFLARAIASVARQTYRACELVVVNDAGVPVDDLVASVPNARVITHERNAGLGAARNTGLQHARGTYVGFLDDDDLLLPDHVAVLTGALESSGASVATSDWAICDFEAQTGGGFNLVSLWAITSVMERSEQLVENRIGNLSVLARRDAYARVGGFDPNLHVMEDYEMWVRLSSAFDFVNVARITALYAVRRDASNMTDYRMDAFAPTLEALYAKYPLRDRPALAARRAAVLERVRMKGVPHPDAPLRFSQPIPIERFWPYACVAAT